MFNLIKALLYIVEKPFHKGFFAADNLVHCPYKCPLKVPFHDGLLRTSIFTVDFMVDTYPDWLLIFSGTPHVSIELGSAIAAE